MAPRVRRFAGYCRRGAHHVAAAVSWHFSVRRKYWRGAAAVKRGAVTFSGGMPIVLAGGGPVSGGPVNGGPVSGGPVSGGPVSEVNVWLPVSGGLLVIAVVGLIMLRRR